jgi:cephalosporin hydroxylase
MDSLDWIYIDTNHQYQNTLNELRAYQPLIKRSGYITGHNYTIGNFRNGIRYGVVEAVNQFCNEEHWQLVYLTNEPQRFLSYGICAAGRSFPAEQG